MRSSKIPRWFRPWIFLLLALVIGLVCYLMLKNADVRVLVYVQSDPTITEMLEIIREQREKINYLSTHQKVVYECPDDIPKIKYPRHASDDLTGIVMATDDECGNTSTIDAVIIVHSSADHFQRRERFRHVYSNYTNTKPYRLKVVFLIGSVLDANIHINLETENREHGDTVIGTFLDTYQNLTLKAVMGFRWLANTCHDVKLYLKMDDDVFLDVQKFFTNYWNGLIAARKKNSIHCYVWYNAKVFRTGKWKVETVLFANASYNFPYCSGFFVIVSPDLIKAMYLRARSIDFFWIDDVFLYGMVPAAVGGVQFFQIGSYERLITDSYNLYTRCPTESNCPTWAAVTDGEGQFDWLYKDHVSRTLLARETRLQQAVVKYILSQTIINETLLKSSVNQTLLREEFVKHAVNWTKIKEANLQNSEGTEMINETIVKSAVNHSRVKEIILHLVVNQTLLNHTELESVDSRAEGGHRRLLFRVHSDSIDYENALLSRKYVAQTIIKRRTQNKGIN